jgi:hypothetical protein
VNVRFRAQGRRIVRLSGDVGVDATRGRPVMLAQIGMMQALPPQALIANGSFMRCDGALVGQRTGQAVAMSQPGGAFRFFGGSEPSLFGKFKLCRDAPLFRRPKFASEPTSRFACRERIRPVALLASHRARSFAAGSQQKAHR